jgi:hypothetical protein
MIKYCYIVVEGPQDIEFLIRLLKPYGLRRVNRFSLLDSFWKPLVPPTFPVDDDLAKRVPVPVFLQNSQISVALHSAIGITRISETIEENLSIISASKIFGIGIFLDADDSELPQKRFENLIFKLSPIGLSLPSRLGETMNGSPRFGIFIAPNNSDSGTLEDILLECAKLNYPNLLSLSENYIDSIDTNQLTKDDLKELNKPTGRKKAVISNVSSVLKPGRTLQVSIQDNRWIDEQTMVLDSIKLVKKFLEEITGYVDEI